jgi:hypothetical protein
MDGRQASSPFNSESAFQEQHDDENNQHHGNADDRVRTFAIKPRAFGTPRRGFGAWRTRIARVRSAPSSVA